MLPRQSHAQPNGSGSTLRRFGPALGWGAAIIVLVGLAFIVGGPGAAEEGPTAEPSATAAGAVAIVFGSALDEVSHQVSEPQQAFSSGDTFAYVSRAREPIGDWAGPRPGPAPERIGRSGGAGKIT